MKRVKKKSILIIGIMLCILILPQNVKCNPTNYYLIGGHEILLEKNSYIIWKVNESFGFSFSVISGTFLIFDDYESRYAEKNDKFKLSMYQDIYHEEQGEIAGECLNGKLEFYDFSESRWYTVINLDSFLLYNYTNKVFYTSLSDIYTFGSNHIFGPQFLLYALPMSIDFETYANNTITKTNPLIYNNYTCTSNSINFTQSETDGGYNYISLKSNGIVNQWIYNLSSQKIIVEYESQGVISPSFSYIQFVPVLIMCSFGGLYGIRIVKKRKPKFNDI